MRPRASGRARRRGRRRSGRGGQVRGLAGREVGEPGVLVPVGHGGRRSSVQVGSGETT